MFKKIICLTILTSILPLTPMAGQTVAELWLAMPTELAPYITLEQKKEMVAGAELGTGIGTVNQLNETSSIDTLAADYGRFRLSSTRLLHVLRLPRTDADSLICLIDTYLAPEAESAVTFYDMSWQPDREARMPRLSAADFITKPDTMATKEFDELRSLLSPELIAFSYDAATAQLTATLSTPMTTTEEKQRLCTILGKKVLIWDGKKFK